MNTEVPSKNPFLIPLEGGVLFIALIQVGVLLASSLKVRINSTMAFSLLAVSLLLAAGFVMVKNKRDKGRAPVEARTWIWRITMLLVAACAAVYALLWFLAIVAPDLSWDGNAYHIPPISMWASAGGVNWIDTPYLEGIINGYPKGAEVVAYVLAMGLGNGFLNTANLLFLPLGVLGIACMAYVLGARVSLSLLAGMLFLLVPVNVNQAQTTYVDSAFACCVIALCALWLNAIQKNNNQKWGWAIPLGAAIGLAIAVKSTGIALSGLALLLLLLISLVRAGRKARRENPAEGKNKRARWRSLLLALVLILVTAVLTGGYWYMRNFAHTGTPLYPVGLTVFGRTIFPGMPVAEAISAGSNTPQEIANLPGVARVAYTWLQDLRHWPVSIKGYDTRLAGLGWLWIIGCVPAIVLFIILKLKKRALTASGFVALLVLIGGGFVLTPMNWWARYTLWIYALGLPVFAVMLERFSDSKPGGGVGMRLGRAWLAVCILVAIFEGLYCSMDAVALATPGSMGGSPLALLRAETWRWPTSYLFPEMSGTAVEELLSEVKVVGIGPHGDSDYTQYTGLVGQLCQPIGKRQVLFLSEDVPAGEVELSGIEGILWDRSVPLPEGLEGFPAIEVGEFIVVEVR